MKKNKMILEKVGNFGILMALCLWLPSAIAENVITSGSSLKVVAGSYFVSSESLTVKSGATMDNAGTLILLKNLANENAAANSIGAGTARFSGAVAQSMSGQNIIQNLTVNNALGLTLAGNTQVNGVFTLTSGKVSLGTYNLLLGNSATISGTPSATAMVIATGTGELRKVFASGFTGSITWPVGDATVTSEYSPVTLTFSGGTFGAGNYAGIKLTNAGYAGLTGSYLNRYWALSLSGITTPTYSALFQYLPTDVVGTESQISCLKVDPPPTVAYNPANTTLHQLTASGLTASGIFTGGMFNTTVTDVISLNPGWNLISFDVTVNPDSTHLVFAPLIATTNLVTVTGFQDQQGVYYLPPPAPGIMNTLKTLANNEGYWVKVINATTLTVQGQDIPDNFTILLATGWNLISWPWVNTTPAAAFANLNPPGVLLMVTGFEIEGFYYDPANPDSSTLGQIKNGLGYWVKVSSNSALTYPQ